MKRTVAVLSAVLALNPVVASAQDSAKLTELERKLDAVTQEIEKLKLGEAAAEPAATESVLGFAPAASKVYRAQPNKVSIGGYGEMTYQNFSKRRQDADPAGVRDEADFLRAILYAGYKFNDWILFNSEIEFEHGTTKVNGTARGEVSVELAAIDFRFRPELGVRAGMLLMPMGLLNEVHEPTTFHGVKRTSVEQNIIPSTWRENGAGVFGEWGPLSYRSYVVTGLQATSNTGVTGFSSSSGLRNGRSSGAKSFAEDIASVTRVDYAPVAGVLVGGSFYVGQADQSLVVNSVPVTLWEGHLKAEYRGAQLRALYAEGKRRSRRTAGHRRKRQLSSSRHLHRSYGTAIRGGRLRRVEPHEGEQGAVALAFRALRTL